MCRDAPVCATALTFTPVFSLTPGYTLRSIKQTNTGLTASLSLAGPACNAFGQDIANLTIQVTYETSSRYALASAFTICSLTSSIFRYEVFMSIYSIRRINNIRFPSLSWNVLLLLPSHSKVRRILFSTTNLRHLHSGSPAALSRMLRLCSIPESRPSRKRQYPLLYPQIIPQLWMGFLLFLRTNTYRFVFCNLTTIKPSQLPYR